MIHQHFWNCNLHPLEDNSCIKFLFPSQRKNISNRLMRKQPLRIWDNFGWDPPLFLQNLPPPWWTGLQKHIRPGLQLVETKVASLVSVEHCRLLPVGVSAQYYFLSVFWKGLGSTVYHPQILKTILQGLLLLSLNVRLFGWICCQLFSTPFTNIWAWKYSSNSITAPAIVYY